MYSNRGPSAYQPNALPLGQNGSRSQVAYALDSLSGLDSLLVVGLSRRVVSEEVPAGTEIPRDGRYRQTVTLTQTLYDI